MRMREGTIVALTLLWTAGAVAQQHDIEALARTVWIEEFDLSPDGSLIAFKSAKAGTYDIWIVPTAGGEPRQLTSLPGREMAPRFHPDGRTLVFEADHGGTEVRDLYRVAVSGGDPERLTEHPLDDRGTSWSPDGSKLYFTTQMFWDRSTAELDLSTGSIRRVGPGGGVVSPDGRSVVLTQNRKAGDDDQSNNDIYVMEVADGDARLLTPDTLDALDRAPVWSPDSKQIAFISDRQGWNNLGIIDVASGATHMLFDEAIEHSEPRWSPDGHFVSFTKNLDYHYEIFVVEVATGDVRQLTDLGGVTGGSSATGQTRGDHRWLPDGSGIVSTHSDPARTGDLWHFSVSAERVSRQITDHQDPALGGPETFVWPELMEYESFDGLTVAGLVYKPHGATTSEPTPGLFFFRANSNGQHPVQWHPYIQYFVSRGYVVFAPNFRGSTGRGKAYRQAVHRHGGDHDLRDAFIGMDRLAAEGWVDPERVGAFGGSTGGFYTTTAVTKDPERFKAGVVWYGSTDLVTLSTYGGMEGWNRYLIGDTPLENPQGYYDRSIIYHAAKIRTPLLFLYAQGDPAARFQQIEQYGVQAKIHDNWFDWVVYEGEPHGWYHWRPDSVERSLRIMEQMFATFLLGERRPVKALATEQREGITLTRNPTIDLWNSLTHGRRR